MTRSRSPRRYPVDALEPSRSDRWCTSTACPASNDNPVWAACSRNLKARQETGDGTAYPVKYVCLVYRDAERLSPADASNLFDDVQQSGHASAGALLDPAIGLTVRAGHLEIESGREGGSAAGYILIEARDLNDAIRLA